ncbi:unnamed protein product, partial [Polarella glacialis]
RVTSGLRSLRAAAQRAGQGAPVSSNLSKERPWTGGVGPVQPGRGFQGEVEAAVAKAVPRLQSIARSLHVAGGAGSLQEWSELWVALDDLQESLYLRGSCPDGSFLVPLRSLGLQYHLCIRQPESASSYMGASLVDKHIMSHGAFPDCEEAVEFLPARSGCIVLDVGANIGSCSLLFARLGVRVIAVEAEPVNLELLRASLRLAQPPGPQFANVSVAAVAVDEAAGFVWITRDATNAGNSSTSSVTDTSEASLVSELSTPVAAARLDDVAEAHAGLLGGSMSDICFMKMDIEAAELRALHGAPRLLASQMLRAVHFEFVPLGRDGGGGVGIRGGRELLELLAANGFVVYGHGPVLQRRVYGPLEFDELIARLAAVGKLGTSLTALRPR